MYISEPAAPYPVKSQLQGLSTDLEAKSRWNTNAESI